MTEPEIIAARYTELALGGRPMVTEKRRLPTFSEIPKDKWPFWAKALARLATPDDKGIGDVVRRIIGEENSDAFKKWFRSVTGKNCGCSGRQKYWNSIYPL